MHKFRTTGSSIELDPQWILKMTPVLNGRSVGLYARISGNKSLDGTSLESQVAVNRRFALACGAKVVAEKKEVITGIFITARSQFNALLQMAERGEIKYIVVDVRDRLGRGDAIAVLEFLTHQAGAQIVYATQPADLDTYEGAALDATEMLVSRIERLNIRRRTNRGRREWSSAGRIFTGRFFPYGYRLKIERDDKGRLIERTLIVHELEARTVRLIYKWFVFEDQSCYAIAVRLEHQGVAVPEGQRGRRNKSATQWYASTVQRILENETYAGTWHYGKRFMKKYESGSKIRYKTGKHDSSNRIAINVPAIVDRELWNSAQVTLKRHSLGGHPPKYGYLLRGMVRCIKSNANLTGQTVKDRHGNAYGYYVCPHRSPLLRLDHATRCKVNQLPQRKLENWVWSTIMELAQDPTRITDELELRKKNSAADRTMLRTAISSLDEEITKLGGRKEKLLDLYLNQVAGVENLTREEYEKRNTQLSRELKQAEAKRTELLNRTQDEVVDSEQAKPAGELLEAVRAASSKANFDERRAVLRLLDTRVLYDRVTLQLGCHPNTMDREGRSDLSSTYS